MLVNSRATLVAALLAAALFLPASVETALAQPAVPELSQSPPPPPVSGTILQQAYARDMAKIAYVWGWPLVNLRNRRLVFSQLPESGLGDGVLPVAPLNHLTMLTSYIAPEERAVACPNQDVVYGFGIFSLDKEPAVFQVPDFGDRFWVYQLGNQRTDSIGQAGKMYGTKPGFYMVVGPDWSGTVPAGIAGVYRSPTNLAYIIPRAFMDDTAEDRQAIQPVISQIMAYPLSQYDGKQKTKDWSKIPKIADPAGGKQGAGSETQWVKPDRFFDELPAILKEVPPLPGEEALYAWLGSLVDAAAKDPALKKTLTQAAIDADKEIMLPLKSFRYSGVPVQNGWNSPLNGANFGTDYYTRAAVARTNIFVNALNETAYFYQEYDGNKKRLNGKGAYTVTFAKGEVPPVDGFWSLTLYDAEHFFAPNELNRFSLGTKNKDLKFNPDGSLTIYVQRNRPSADKQSNWLPAPRGDFELYIRAYWPKESVLRHAWAPPIVVRSK